MSRSIVAIGLPFLLGACSTLYPPLYSAPTIAETAPDGTLKADCQSHQDPLDQTLACAEILQDVSRTATKIRPSGRISANCRSLARQVRRHGSC